METPDFGSPQRLRGLIAETVVVVGVRLIGGPTALIEIGGLRLLTDPTFDPPGDYPIASRKLTKVTPPALAPDELGPIDAVLLSHDQHPDNLDHRGREVIAATPVAFSTPAAAERIGSNVHGLAPWEMTELQGLQIMAVPALHGPPGSEPLVGPVTGFILSGRELPTVYVSGDNASLELVRGIAARCGPVDVAVIFAGGAQTALLGDAFLTLPSAGAAEAARILDAPHVVPVHLEGWTHFTQGPDSLRAAFTNAGLQDRLCLLDPGSRFEMTPDR